jgi:RNA:NAD 2'-phosphotransferase (TPT1/KptA family)
MNSRPQEAHNFHEENCLSDEMADVLRQKTEQERLEIGFEMWRAADRMIRAAVKQQYPHWSDEEVQHEVARRLSHGSV